MPCAPLVHGEDAKILLMPSWKEGFGHCTTLHMLSNPDRYCSCALKLFFLIYEIILLYLITFNNYQITKGKRQKKTPKSKAKLFKSQG